MPAGAEGLLSGRPEDGVDARGIQPFYTGILARMTDMDLKIGIENDVFSFTNFVLGANLLDDVAAGLRMSIDIDSTNATGAGGAYAGY